MAQTKALTKPKFIKVKDLENLRNGYNVYVKVISAQPKTIETHEGLKIPMVDCIVADETGSAKAFFKGDNATQIKAGNILAIRNGVIRLNKNHISLEVDLFGRVTLEKDVTINPTEALDISAAEHKYPNRRNTNRRQGDRPRNKYRAELGERGERGERREREDRGNRGNRDNREFKEERADREARREPRREYDKPQRYYKKEEREGGYRRDNRTERREGGERREDRQNRYPPRTRQYQQPRQERRKYNRDYERREDRPREYKPRINYTEKREENRGERKPLNWTKIADISPGDDNLNLNVKIIQLTKVGTNKYRCIIGDSSGVSNAFLPNRIDLREGDSIALFAAQAQVVKEHIEIQLPERGRVELSRRPVDKISQEFNLSSKAWVPIE